MAKKATKSIAEDFSTVTIEFGDNGAAGSVKCVIEDLDEAIQAQGLAHGISQKLGDSYAGLDTPEEAFAACQGVLEQLLAGNWRTGGGGGGGPRVSQLAAALARIQGAPIEEAQKVVENLSDDQKKALRKSAVVKKAIAEIQLEASNKEIEEGGEKSLSEILGGS